MPRLTQPAYQTIHEHLRQLWRHDQRYFAELSAPEQWSLHAFFMPNEAMSPGDLVAYRKFISDREPSLPDAQAKH